MKRLLKEKKGFSYPLTVAIVLGILIITTGIFEAMRLFLLAQGIKDAVQSSIITVAVENHVDTYAPVREGYSANYQNDGDGFYMSINEGDIYARLGEVLGISGGGDRYVKYIGADGDAVEYYLSNLTFEKMMNTPLAPDDREETGRWSATVDIDLEVPLSFGWGHLPPMKMTLHCKAGYTPKF